MKYKVGDKITIKGKTYKIVSCNTNSCEDCAFKMNLKTCFDIGWYFNDVENIKFVEVSGN